MSTDISSNNQFYDYLVDRFENVQILSSGDYKVKTGGNEFYFSKDCVGSDVNVFSYYPGDAGLKGEYECTIQYRNDLVENGVPSNSVVMFSGVVNDEHNTLETFDSVANDLGIGVSGLQNVCFSGSGALVFKRTNEYLTKHPEIADSTSIVAIDPYILEKVGRNDFPINELQESEVPVYFVTDYRYDAFSKRNREWVSKLSDMGLNTYLIEINKKVGHRGTVTEVMKDGLVFYLAGNTDELGNSDLYSFYKQENGNFELVDVDEIRVNRNWLAGLPKIDDIVNMETYLVEDIGSDVRDKFNKSTLVNLSLFTVTSDFEYVQKFANGIVNSISSDSFFESTLLNVSGGCGPLVDIINECLTLYYDAVGDLLNKISMEADYIVGIGQSYVNVDTDLEQEAESTLSLLAGTTVSTSNLFAEEVTDSNNVFVDTSSKKDGEETVVTELQTKVNTETKDNLDKNDSNSVLVNEDNNDKNTNQLSSERSSQPVSSSQSNSNKSPSYSSPSSNGNNHTTTDVSEVVYDKGDYNVVFEMNGNNITSMKYKFEYGTLEEANNIFELLANKLNENQNIENVVLDGNVIEIMFKDNVFENMSVNNMLEINLMEGLM